MKMRLPILLFSSLALLSCGTTPNSSSDPVSSSSKESAESSISSESSKSSEASQSKESSASSSKEESVSSEESIPSVIESSEESSSIDEESSSETEVSSEEESLEESSSAESSEESSADWELTYENIPTTTAGKYNIEFDFSNDDASFHGSYLQRGGGDKNGIPLDETIQVKAEKDGSHGYFYLTSGIAYRLSFAILRIHSFYGGEDHDFTGVPTVYSAETMDDDNGEEVTLEKTLTTDKMDREVYLYEATLPHPAFRFENRSGYVIYLSSFHSLPQNNA